MKLENLIPFDDRGYIFSKDSGFDSNKTIIGWEFYGARLGTLKLQVWRPKTPSDGEHIYQLRAQTYASVKVGYNMIHLQGSDSIQVSKGDVIGIGFISQVSIPYIDRPSTNTSRNCILVRSYLSKIKGTYVKFEPWRVRRQFAVAAITQSEALGEPSALPTGGQIEFAANFYTMEPLLWGHPFAPKH